MNYKPRILGIVFRLVFVLSWYKVRCSEYTRQALENTSVVSEIWRNNSRVSLAFVFDRTGSMYDDLVQVRAGATRIFNSTIQNGTSPVTNYILVPFRDPGKLLV
jgi:hemicentin